MPKGREQQLIAIRDAARQLTGLAAAYDKLRIEAEKADSSQPFLDLVAATGDLVVDGLDKVATILECIDDGRRQSATQGAER